MDKLFKKTIMQNIMNVVVFGVCMGILLLGMTSIIAINEIETRLPTTIEQTWRTQARRQLDDLRNRLIQDIKDGKVQIDDESSLQNWSKLNLANVLNGGPTGDGFMVNLGNEKFLWDGSPDCARPEFIINGRYLKDEAALHTDPAQATKMIELMKLGSDTTEGDNYYWLFDDSPEYLEWVVIPPSKLGFNNEPYTIGGIKNVKYSKIMIQLGTQKDEIEAPYSSIFKALEHAKQFIYVLITVCYIICIFNMSVFVFLAKRKNKNS